MACLGVPVHGRGRGGLESLWARGKGALGERMLPGPEIHLDVPCQEELKHFEAKVEKHHHYQKQLEISQEKLKHVEGTGDKEHLSRNKEKYSVLEGKTKELGYKVGEGPGGFCGAWGASGRMEKGRVGVEGQHPTIRKGTLQTETSRHLWTAPALCWGRPAPAPAFHGSEASGHPAASQLPVPRQAAHAEAERPSP